jgi:hypothetical protein
MVSLPYHQILGAPLVAIIEAEALAARATADFIADVGFVRNGKEKETSVGQLRSVTFTYRKQDIDGNDVEEEIELPLLSLLPIPMLQIKDASVKFNLKITDTDPQSVRDTSKTAPLETISRKSPTLMASLRSTDSKGVTANADMQVEINIKQSDIPAGLQKLFQVMENAVQSRPVVKVVDKKTLK